MKAKLIYYQDRNRNYFALDYNRSVYIPEVDDFIIESSISMEEAIEKFGKEAVKKAYNGNPIEVEVDPREI